MAVLSEALRDCPRQPHLPPGSMDESSPDQTGGSFSIDGLREREQGLIATGGYRRPTIADGHDYVLPDDGVSRPIDEVSGLPYCFVPVTHLPRKWRNWSKPCRVADYDHQYPTVETIHGGNPLLREHKVAEAMNNLRLQFTTRTNHETWDKSEFIGPLQPATRKQLAAVCVSALANYVPKGGIDFVNNKPILRWLSDQERRFLIVSSQVRVASAVPVVRYLYESALLQNRHALNDAKIDEFLFTSDPERRLRCGHGLMATLLERQFEPFEAQYLRLRASQEITTRDEIKGKFSEAPETPGELVLVELHRAQMIPYALRLFEERVMDSLMPAGATA